MKKFLLCVMLITVIISSADAYTYNNKNKNNYNNNTSVKKADDKYYTDLITRFPSREDKRVIDSLYNKYSGWVINFAQCGGMPPLYALSAIKNPDSMFYTLDKHFDIFMDLYNSFENAFKFKSVKERAKTALVMLNAFNDDQDDKASENFIRTLKSEQYQTLLAELSELDAETLSVCSLYPNALTFLLNTGREGLPLIREKNGEIIALSCLLDDNEQKKLPENFSRYPGLKTALKYFKAPVYFTVMACPDLFFELISRLQGTEQERYEMAYAVLLCATGDAGDVQFLKNLSRSDCERLASAAAEIMNLPDSEEKYLGCSLAPIRESLFMRFVNKYGDLAIDACKNFSAIVDMSDLMMNNWDGANQDVQPVLEAIHDYGDMGLQAAINFRHHRDTQNFLLNYPADLSQRTALLMFWLYDNLSNHHYTSNIGSREDGAKYMLDEYTPKKGTGLPEPKKDGIEFVEFIPGHDVVAPIYNFVVYGKTPTLWELGFGALDLIQFIPIVGAAGGLARQISQGGFKSVVGNLKKAAVKSVQSIGNSVMNTLDDIVKGAGKLTLKQIRAGMSTVVQELGERSSVLFSRLALPSVDDFADLAKSVYHQAKKLGIGIIDDLLEMPVKYGKHVNSLAFGHGYTKRAANALVHGIAAEVMLEPTAFYMGTNALLNHLKR